MAELIARLRAELCTFFPGRSFVRKIYHPLLLSSLCFPRPMAGIPGTRCQAPVFHLWWPPSHWQRKQWDVPYLRSSCFLDSLLCSSLPSTSGISLIIQYKFQNQCFIVLELPSYRKSKPMELNLAKPDLHDTSKK